MGGALEQLRHRRGPRPRRGPGDRRLQRGGLLRPAGAPWGGGTPGEVPPSSGSVPRSPSSERSGDRLRRGKVRVGSETDLHLEEPRDFRDKYAIATSSGRCTKGTGAARRRQSAGGWKPTRTSPGQCLRPERLLVWSTTSPARKRRCCTPATTTATGPAPCAPRSQRRPGHDRHRGGPALPRVDRGPLSTASRTSSTGDVHATDTWSGSTPGSGCPYPGPPWSWRRRGGGRAVAALSATRSRTGRSRATPSVSPAASDRGTPNSCTRRPSGFFRSNKAARGARGGALLCAAATRRQRRRWALFSRPRLTAPRLTK